MLDRQISHDKVTRSLASDPKTSADLWQIVKPMIRTIEDANQGAILLDDSILEKPYTDENELVCWH